jgi:hypothetical protein
VLEHREEVAQKGIIEGRLVIGADGLKVQQRGVDGVVLGCLPLVGEAIGEHPLGNIVWNSN